MIQAELKALAHAPEAGAAPHQRRLGPRDLGRWSEAPPEAFPYAHCSDSGVSDPVNEPGPAVCQRLAEEKNVWLCTVRPDGSAHVTPVWFVHQSSQWWIGSDHSSVKVRNIHKEPRVSLALEDGRFRRQEQPGPSRSTRPARPSLAAWTRDRHHRPRAHRRRVARTITPRTPHSSRTRTAPTATPGPR
ncbi:pyridoxamine 5'-phosphate oxidase family protein [Streptomyces sp. NPDC059994]|uniref:pyridoxamine 5'-phosphate oxidase family protein n=1 Tax=Streptomyces sp. NPDC059994 TaxID=3347029 RepID=UPI00367861A0